MSPDEAAVAANPVRLPLEQQVQALRRIALAAARPESGNVYEHVVSEVARALGVAAAMVATFADARRETMRTLAMWVHGSALPTVEYPLAQSPCVEVVGRGYRFIPCGVQSRYGADEMVAGLELDSYAAYPMTDSRGEPLGLVAALDPRCIAGGDAGHAEAVLQIAAARLAAEIERSAASAALLRSEASYRAIFESAEDAIFVHDWDSGRILDVNPKACETYGYTREELLALSVADVSAGEPPYTLADAQHWLALARQGRCPPFEWRRRNKEGSLHWDEVRLKPALIDGRPHVLAFTRDITEHKAALAALEAREAKFRAIFDASDDGMVLCDSRLRVVDINQAFTRLNGFARDDVIGIDLAGRLPQPDPERRLELLRQALDGMPGHIVTPTRRKDGSHFHIELRYLPVHFGGERHVLAVGRDVSERVQRAQALQRSEARLRATIEAAFDCVVAMDGEGRIVEFNASAERVFGYRRDEVLGASLAETLLPQRHRAAHERGLRHFHVSGRGPMVGRLVETTARRSDGVEIPVELAISVAAVPEGSIFVGYLRDISARRHAEKERLELEAQLRQAQKMEAIGQLTGGIAHDFNNILTSVIGYVVLAQERAEAAGDATAARQLTQAHAAADRARGLIAQMLAFARRRPVEKRTVRLAPIVRQTLLLLRAALPATVEVDCALLRGEPASDDDATAVDGDPVQLEQVLFNLCLNARDAVEGAGRISVQVQRHTAAWRCSSCRMHGSGRRWLALSVGDDGCGIAAEHVERLFEPFYSTKDPGRGSGMGLAMVHGIVHDHGGHVLVESAPGRGATFRVLLPEAAGAASEGLPALAAPGDKAGPPLRGSVLLVEDDPMAGDFMRERLASWGLTVLLQRSPLEALATLDDAGQRVDLLLTDHTMPTLTGLELAARAVERRPGLPALLYTGQADPVDDEALAQHGVRALLRKPVDAATLRAALQRWLPAGDSP